MKKNSVSYGTVLLIGVVIAAVSIAQDNYGGAVFAALVCGVVAFLAYRKSVRTRRR